MKFNILNFRSLRSVKAITNKDTVMPSMISNDEVGNYIHTIAISYQL